MGPSRGTPRRGECERMFADAGIAPPRVPSEWGSVITIRQILMDSDFLTLLSPDQVAVELEAGWLRRICDVPPGLVRRIGLTTRANWRPTARQASFIELPGKLANSGGVVSSKIDRKSTRLNSSH